MGLWNMYNRYIFFSACKFGDVEKVSEILHYKPNMSNSINNKGIPALHLAVLSNNTNIVNLLISYGADVNVKDKYGNTAKQIAEYRGQNDIAEILLENGAS